MKAADVMVTSVISVGPEVRVQDVANILLKNRISAVPVISADGSILGIVSEGDLMRRAEVGTDRRRSWWLAMLTGREALAADYVRENSRKVTDIMTRDVVSVKPDTELREIATLLEKHSIKRVPVVQDGKLVGIVSRANLLQALAGLPKEIEVGAPDDPSIRNSVVARLNSASWARPALINVIVQNGTVDLRGVVDSQIEKEAVLVAAEVTPGVRAVNDHLVVRPAETGM
jgi:CBS domain-containing protein